MDLVRNSRDGTRPHPESLSSCWEPIHGLDGGRVNSPSRETLLGDNNLDPEEGKQIYSCGGQFTRNDDPVILLSSLCKDGYAYTRSNAMPESVFTMTFARSLFGFHFLLYFSSHFLEDAQEAQRSIDGQRMLSVSISDWTHQSFHLRVL